MATLTGTVQVLGVYNESTATNFTVDLWVQNESSWRSIFPIVTEIYPDGFIFQWDTTRIPDGSYVLRVTLTDVVGHNGTTQVNVTLANARLSIDPLGISFSNPRPEVGEDVTVWVEVHNTGDADAEDVSVEFIVNGTLEHLVEGLTIPGHSTVLVSYPTTAYDAQYRARAFSDLYDSGLTSELTLVPKEAEVEEVSEDDPAQTLAILALVLAVIALLIALMMVVRPPGKVPDRAGYVDNGGSMIEVADDWEETRDEET